MSDIVVLADKNNEFVTLDDGFVYYWPNGAGDISSHELRTLADELDSRNKAWHDDINRYFDGTKDD